MSKKLCIGLLATAFVVMPAAAQATEPHWHLNGNPTSIPVGEEVPTVSWGTLTVVTPAPFAPIKCRVALLGQVVNPTNSKAGEGATQAFASSSCEDVDCPFAMGEEIQMRGENLPWPDKLIAGGGSLINLETTDIELEVSCVELMGGRPVRDPADEDDYKANSGPFYCSGLPPLSKGTGIWLGKVKNGVGSSSEIPTKMEYAAGTNPVLQCPAPFGPEITITGKLKTMGYESSELLEARNP